jgi:hypothetical protein
MGPESTTLSCWKCKNDFLAERLVGRQTRGRNDTDRLCCLILHPDLLLNNQAGLYSILLGVGAQVWIKDN